MTKHGRWRFIRPGEAIGPVPPGIPGPGGVTTTTTTTTTRPSAFSTPGTMLGGFQGVASTSTEKSLRIFNGKKDNVIGFDPLAWMKDRQPAAPAAGDTPVTARGDAADDSLRAPVAGHSSTPETTDRPPATDDAPDAIVLGDTLTIEQVAALHADLGKRLTPPRVVLQAQALTRVDAAGLQLLTAFVRAAEARGVGDEWQAPPPALREAARRLGLSAALRLA